ncbi:MAG: FAD-dependent oxidoreductase [Clostridia bacterium]|nr:FAD-dependent oxidoreductase [Clostridia bacterium]
MKKYDLIVVGGGLTGVAAAVAAARQGISVLLVERNGCLGGAMSNSFVYPFMKHSLKDKDKNITRVLSAGIFGEMVERHKEMGGTDIGWQPEIFKIMLDEMITEANVDVFFHTQLADVQVENRELKSVLLAGKEGLFEVEADFFIDASGDGDLMAYAGCDYQLGREEDNLCQPMTTCFRMSNIDNDAFYKDLPRLLELYKQKQASGEITNPRENILRFTGIGKDICHFNTTRVIKHNPTDTAELSKAEIIARKQVLEMYNFLRENSESCKNATLISVATEIGVRESRKLKGVHVLTADELKNSVDFEDSIALGNYDIDIHNPSGTGTYIYKFEPEQYYRIPYRSLLPKETDNLLVAGRCLSATHEAHSAVRIMPICACLGEAAGIAAAEAIKTNTNAHTVNISAVQDKITANGGEIH